MYELICQLDIKSRYEICQDNLSYLQLPDLGNLA